MTDSRLGDLADEVAWLAAVHGSLSFREHEGDMVVRVTVEPVVTTLVVVKRLVVGQPVGAVVDALRVAREEVRRHRRRSMLYLVKEVSC